MNNNISLIPFIDSSSEISWLELYSVSDILEGSLYIAPPTRAVCGSTSVLEKAFLYYLVDVHI